MPTTFDFKNTALAPRVFTSFSSSSIFGTATNTDGGATFTLSGYAYSGGSYIDYLGFGFANSSGAPGIFFSVSSLSSFLTSASFTIRVSSAGNTQFNGLNSLVFSAPTSSQWFVSYLGASGTPLGGTVVTGSQTLTATGQISAIRFSSSHYSHAYIGISSMTVGTMNCFCAGTLIETPDGPRAVETLQAGDKVLTADGKETTVSWLGEQDIDTRLRHPKMVNPICITEGALGDGLPSQDLHLSKDHAIEIDGTLCNAGALVNGSTIYQVAQMPLDGFKYYHVDTGTHELLLANGVSAESYIDYAGTEGFVNGDARSEGETIDEMDLPRVSSSRQVPADVRARLQASPDEIAA